MILPYVLATVLYVPIAYYFLSKGQDIPYSYVKLKPTELLVGFDKKTEKPLIVDMLSVPHLLVTGLSGQGKSRMLRAMLLNIKDANIVVCNAFKNDYKGVQARFINGEDNVKTYIKNTSTDLHRRDIPLYIVLEELGTIKNKDTIKYIQELLCVARHYNIYVIGVIQIGTFHAYMLYYLRIAQIRNGRFLAEVLSDVMRKKSATPELEQLSFG